MEHQLFYLHALSALHAGTGQGVGAIDLPIARARDARTLTLLTFAPGCAYRQRLEHWLASDGVLPERVVELSSYHAMLGCIASGMGIAMAPLSLLEIVAVAGSVSVHMLDPAHADSPTWLVWRAGGDGPTVRALRQALLDKPAAGAG